MLRLCVVLHDVLECTQQKCSLIATLILQPDRLFPQFNDAEDELNDDLMEVSSPIANHKLIPSYSLLPLLSFPAP